MRTYSSFLLRCWSLNGDRPRIEIEHVQTGERTRAASLPQALEWISQVVDASDVPEAKESGR